jgi:hypothetical protein
MGQQRVSSAAHHSLFSFVEFIYTHAHSRSFSLLLFPPLFDKENDEHNGTTTATNTRGRQVSSAERASLPPQDITATAAAAAIRRRIECHRCWQFTFVLFIRDKSLDVFIYLKDLGQLNFLSSNS